MPEDKIRACEEDFQRLADLYKMFADPTRVKIMYTLSGGELCVQDIAEALDMTQSAISHQLSILRQARLVKSRRDGRSIRYSLDDDHVEWILAKGMEHVREE